MKVRAKQHGQYKGTLHEPGSVFEIEDGTYPIFEVDRLSNVVMKDGKPVVRENRPHLEHWMEKVPVEERQEQKGFMGRILHGGEKEK